MTLLDRVRLSLVQRIEVCAGEVREWPQGSEEGSRAKATAMEASRLLKASFPNNEEYQLFCEKKGI